MNRAVILAALAACGDNGPAKVLAYTDPGDGALRLIANPRSTPTRAVLDLVVGDAPVTGFATGFDLPLDLYKVSLAAFTPGTALDAGTQPQAAAARIATAGPFAGMLVVGQSQKAGGAGAVATDTELAPHTVLFTVELTLDPHVTAGVIFDGTAKQFALPSGGLRRRDGTTAVAPAAVKIGKLSAR